MARPLCLLLLDADLTRQSLVRSAMRRRADMVLTATTPAEAWRLLEQSTIPIDRALIDDPESGETAVAFAAELSRRYPHIGVVLSVTSLTASGYPMLQKPYGIHELWAVLA